MKPSFRDSRPNGASTIRRAIDASQKGVKNTYSGMHSMSTEHNNIA